MNDLKKLRNLRMRKGVTQKEVADFINVSRNTYTNYELGEREPNIETLLKLAEYFNVSIDYLLGFSQENNRVNKETLEFIDNHARENSTFDPTKYVQENDKLRAVRFSDRFKLYMETVNFDYGDLSKITNIPINRLILFESNEDNPTLEELEKIANYFNVSPGFLVGFVGYDNDYISKQLDKYNKKNTPSGVHRINVLGSVPAGIPLEAIEDIVDWEEIPAEWLKKGEYFALQLDGDSMSPKYLDRDVVIFKKQSDVDCGQNALVYVNGYDATFKKIIKKEDGTIILQPLNPEYSPIVVNDDETFTVVGIPVEIRRKEDL